MRGADLRCWRRGADGRRWDASLWFWRGMWVVVGRWWVCCELVGVEVGSVVE